MTLNVAVFLGSKLGKDSKNLKIIKDFSDWFGSEKLHSVYQKDDKLDNHLYGSQ